MREELFLANLAPDAFISAVHRAGTINTECGPVAVDAALFDVYISVILQDTPSRAGTVRA